MIRVITNEILAEKLPAAKCTCRDEYINGVVVTNIGKCHYWLKKGLS